MDADNGLLIEPRLTGRKRVWAVTVKLNGDVVYADEVKISKKAERQQFVEAVRKEVPAVPVDELESELLKLLNDSSHDQSGEHTGGSDLLESTPEHVRKEAESMLADPSLMHATASAP